MTKHERTSGHARAAAPLYVLLVACSGGGVRETADDEDGRNQGGAGVTRDDSGGEAGSSGGAESTDPKHGGSGGSAGAGDDLPAQGGSGEQPAAGSGGTPSGNGGAVMTGASGTAGAGGSSGAGGHGGSPPIVSAGLVGYWKMDDAPGSLFAADVAGSPDNATLLMPNANSGFVEGRIARAYDFQNADEQTPRFRIEPSDEMNSIVSGVTIAVWVYKTPGKTGGSSAMFVQRDSPSGKGYYGIGTKSHHDLAWFGEHISWGVDLPGNQVPDRVWKHVAGTYDKATKTLVLYMDGKELGRNTSWIPLDPLGPDTTPIHVGRRSDNTPGWDMDGKLDDIRLYNRALTPAEISEIYAGTAPP